MIKTISNLSELLKEAAKDNMLCSQWMQEPEKAVKWFIKNGGQIGYTIKRHNINHKYSPDNCYVQLVTELGIKDRQLAQGWDRCVALFKKRLATATPNAIKATLSKFRVEPGDKYEG